jgi:signal transduction histidine kinase
VTTVDIGDFWQRSKIGWHATAYGLFAVMTAVVGLDSDVSRRERPVAFALVGALTIAYTLIGRSALGADDVRRSVAYLLPAWAILGALGTMVPDAFLLLFVLAPQTWAMLPTTRWAAAWNAGGTAWLVGGQVAAGAPARGAVIFGVLNLSISLLLGYWISGIIEESGKRAGLIEQLERAQSELAASEHERGILTERQRLAHEIHDTLAQGFTSVLALAQAVEVSLDRDQANVRRGLSMLQATARDNLAEARALVGALTPPDLDNATVADAIGRVTSRFADETGVDVDFAALGVPRSLSPAAEVVLLRMAQESLANVRKHAKATSVVLRLRHEADAVVLEIRDDGRGFGPDAVPGHGLPGMRARVEQLGGEFSVESAPGAGTTIRARVP